MVFEVLILLTFLVETSSAPPSADLLFSSNRDGDSDVYVLPVGSDTWVDLTDHPSSDNWPVWSPDGTRIAFQSNRDGKLDVWVMNADGSDPRRLTTHEDHDYVPSWTPDGRRITFASWRREPEDDERAVHLYVMDADGSNQQRLVDASPQVSTGADWAPGGEWFLSARRFGDARPAIVRFTPDGTLIARITDGDDGYGSPSVSPAGDAIAFYADRDGKADIVITAIDGSDPRRFLQDRNAWYPRWSPDGQWLVCTVEDPNGIDGDLDLVAISVGDPSLVVELVDGTTRESEGSWRPRQ